MINVLVRLGRGTIKRLAGLGRAFSILLQAIFRPFGAGATLRLWLPEIYSAVLSLVIVAVSRLFIGMVLGLQATAFWSILARNNWAVGFFDAIA